MVLAALPGRMVAERTATDAWIPLRQLTLSEAAFLLKQNQAEARHLAIVELSDDTVSLATRDYVLPAPAPSAPGPDGAASPGEPYVIENATWEGYAVLYELERKPLEAELGRAFSAHELDPTFLDDYSVSLRPSRLPLYVLIEITFITAWGLALVEALRRLRRPSAWLALAAPWLLAPFLVSLLYSPAFFDADWFHQRILIETIGLWLLPPGMVALVALLPLALLSWIIETYLKRARARGAVEFRQSAWRVVGYVTASIAAFALWRTVEWIRAQDRCAAELSQLETRVTSSDALATLLEHQSHLPRATNLLDPKATTPEPVRAAIEALLASTGRVPELEIILLAPTRRTPAENLFLWRNIFRYADIRELDQNLISADAIAQIRRDGAMTSGFGRALALAPHLCGKQITWTGGVATVLMSE